MLTLALEWALCPLALETVLCYGYLMEGSHPVLP